MRSATKVVVDIRNQPKGWGAPGPDAGDVLDALSPHLAPHSIVVVSNAVIQRQGYKAQFGLPSRYKTRWAFTARNLAQGQGRGNRRLIFIVDDSYPVHPIVIGLSKANAAQVVAVGPIRPGISAALELPLRGELVALIAPYRVPVGSWRPDVEIQSTESGLAVEAAQRVLRAKPRKLSSSSTEAIELRPEPPDLIYENPQPPDLGHRVLALARIWATIHFFDPYLDLMSSAWDDTLLEFLPKMVGAETEESYTRALLELAARTDDEHTVLMGNEIELVIPPGRMPFDVMMLDEGVTVVSLSDEPLPIRVGEVVKAVDGVAIETLIQRMLPLCAASMPIERQRVAAKLAMAGAVGSTATLTVWDGSHVRAVEVNRVARTTPDGGRDVPFRLLQNNIGYVNLSTLEVEKVPEMIAKLKDSASIIFDMRGYPRGTLWKLAPWLNRKHARTGARIRENWVVGDAPDGKVAWEYGASIPLTSDSREFYKGRVVMLIDERAYSEAELTALFFESATDVLFIGSPTAGTNGEVTTMAVPGGFALRFSGEAIWHGDGRQLQRVGIQPSILRRPTAAGLRTGRDEVLEEALAALQSPRAPSSAP